MRPTPVVDADDLSFSYGANQVLDGLTLSILEGEIFGLLGANGTFRKSVNRKGGVPSL